MLNSDFWDKMPEKAKKVGRRSLSKRRESLVKELGGMSFPN
jgi:hypothetical protein